MREASLRIKLQHGKGQNKNKKNQKAWNLYRVPKARSHLGFSVLKPAHSLYCTGRPGWSLLFHATDSNLPDRVGEGMEIFSAVEEPRV